MIPINTKEFFQKGRAAYLHVLKASKVCLIGGLICVAPLVVTFYVVSFLVGLVDTHLAPLSSSLVKLVLPDSVLVGPFAGGNIPGLSVVLLAFILVAVGFIASTGPGKKAFKLFDRGIGYVPIVGQVYGGSRKVMDLFRNPDGQPRFKRVVGFYNSPTETADFAYVMEEKIENGRKILRIMTPSRPYPTGGSPMTIPEDRTWDPNITAAQFLMYNLSCGILAPRTMVLSMPPKSDRYPADSVPTTE